MKTMRSGGLALFLLFIAGSGFGQDADKMASIGRYVGTWGGYSGRSTTISGSVDLTSAWVKVVAKKAGPDAVELVGNVWGAKARLKYDTASDKYLLSWSADGFPPVVDLPVQSSGPSEFAGSASVTCGGTECQAEATIKEEKDGGSEWAMGVTQGQNKWRLRLTLGKEK